MHVQDIKVIKRFPSHEIRAIQLTWIWLPFSAVMISTPDGLFKVIIACCIDCDHEMVNLHTLQNRLGQNSKKACCLKLLSANSRKSW